MAAAAPASSTTAKSKWADPHHVIFHYKTEPCSKFNTKSCGDYSSCPYYHTRKDRRREFGKHQYFSSACAHVKVGDEWGEPSTCSDKDDCIHCHTRMEQQFHPEVYKSMKCNDLKDKTICPRGVFCAFAHSSSELPGQRKRMWQIDWNKVFPNGAACTPGRPVRGAARNKSVETEDVGTDPLGTGSGSEKSDTSLLSLSISDSPVLSTKSLRKKKLDLEVEYIEGPKPEPLQLSFASVAAGSKQSDDPQHINLPSLQAKRKNPGGSDTSDTSIPVAVSPVSSTTSPPNNNSEPAIESNPQPAMELSPKSGPLPLSFASVAAGSKQPDDFKYVTLPLFQARRKKSSESDKSKTSILAGNQLVSKISSTSTILGGAPQPKNSKLKLKQAIGIECPKPQPLQVSFASVASVPVPVSGNLENPDQSSEDISDKQAEQDKCDSENGDGGDTSILSTEGVNSETEILKDVTNITLSSMSSPSDDAKQKKHKHFDIWLPYLN